MKKNIFLSVKLGLFITVIVICISSIVLAVTYRDVNTSHWAYKYINYLSNSKVINGYTDGTFKPEGTITKAEFIKLVIMSALPDWISLEDAETNFNHWSAPYIWIAERYGVISSDSINNSNADLPITRLEMVRIISKADIAMKKGNINLNSKVKFNDVVSLNKDDLTLLKHAVSKELITGYTDNSFKPYNNMTRAEASAMIYRFKRGDGK